MNPNRGGRAATLARWADRVEEILRLHRDGLSKTEIAAIGNMGMASVRQALCTSSARGGAAYLREVTGQARWWHRDHWPQMQAYKDRMRDEHRARSLAKRQQRQEQSRPYLDSFERPSVHLWTRADDRPPMHPKGPPSVWELAA